MNQKESILIVDDDESACRSLQLIFGKKGYETEIAKTAKEALEKIKKRSFNVALIDIRLPDMEGTVLLSKLKKVHPEMVCVVITGYASLENAIMAIKLGSNGYFVKPLVMEEVIYRLEEALDKQRLERKLNESEEKYRTLYETIKEGIGLADIEGNILDANQAFLDMLGYKIEEIRRLSYYELTPKKWHKITTDIIKNQTMVRGYSKEYEKEYIKKDGTMLPITIRSWLTKDKQGKPVGTWAIVRDITERKQAEEKIKHLNLFLRTIRRVNQLIVREKDREKLLKGACENLIKTRGYYNTWIVLLDEEGKLKTCAEAGLGKDFLPMIELLKGGKLTTCFQKALKQQEVVIIEDPVSTCTECPLAQKYSGRAGFAIRLEHSGKVYGLMTVSISAHLVIDQEEQSLFKEVAGDIALGLHNIELGENLDKRTYELKKRVKELNCLWEISNLVEKPDISLEAIIKGTVNLLPSTWQYPQITCARIILEAKEYKTKNFKETTWKQSSDITVHQKPVGTVVVYYLEERPEKDEGPFLKEERNLINIIAERLGNLIEGKQSEMKLQQSYQKLQKTMEDTIYTIGKIAETRDPYTSGHQKNVSQIATFIAQEMKLPKDKIEGIRIASLVHDIGKISIPAEILNKPTKLSEIEFSLIKDHSQVGYDVLKSIEFPWPIVQIVLQHHERLDGSGYPNNLIGDKIILEARILGVADVVEAMSSHRPYRPALGIDAALEEITQKKGILYDPEVVSVCLKLFKKKEFKF